MVAVGYAGSVALLRDGWCGLLAQGGLRSFSGQCAGGDSQLPCPANAAALDGFNGDKLKTAWAELGQGAEKKLHSLRRSSSRAASVASSFSTSSRQASHFDVYQKNRASRLVSCVAQHPAGTTEQQQEKAQPLEEEISKSEVNGFVLASVTDNDTSKAGSPDIVQGGAVDETAGAVDLSDVSEWELDFCSRPILDSRGKRVWELLVCDNSRRLQWAQYLPSNRINSTTLKECILQIVDQLNVPLPLKIRFFRAQMLTIISKACVELDIQPVPSQRCVALMKWLEERFKDEYRQQPGYQEDAAPLLPFQEPPPKDLPDNLRGDKWAFVQLPLEGVLEEVRRVQAGDIFGSVFDLEAMGLGGLPSDTMLPGLAVASFRATPLAAWTSAMELAALRADIPKGCVLLSSGAADTWRYAFYRRSSQADAEAGAWEKAKGACEGLHFLAVQSSLDADECAGFWLMRDVIPPRM
eukprot:TRINITY_DN354_c0_g1_i1.p1 TRINITY_DN354_c0_g1~~TRINITY_DN354_c0_g1_i1.p1  ORF type:complete len:506 (-),score=119.63 TRINITY_DN354_c0_g1_i1:180-1580(-)